MGLAQRQPFGSTVIPIGADGEGRWPTDATLEVGGPADLAVLRDDPRVATGTAGRGLATRTLALVRGGKVVVGSFPGHTPPNMRNARHQPTNRAP